MTKQRFDKLISDFVLGRMTESDKNYYLAISSAKVINRIRNGDSKQIIDIGLSIDGGVFIRFSKDELLTISHHKLQMMVEKYYKERGLD